MNSITIKIDPEFFDTNVASVKKSYKMQVYQQWVDKVNATLNRVADTVNLDFADTQALREVAKLLSALDIEVKEKPGVVYSVPIVENEDDTLCLEDDYGKVIYGNDGKPVLKTYDVTMYFHTSDTVRIQAYSEQQAVEFACGYTNEERLLRDMQECDDPDCILVK